jgi:hypothetical protein
MDEKLLDVIDNDEGGEEIEMNDRSLTITFSKLHSLISTNDCVDTPIGQRFDPNFTTDSRENVTDVNVRDPLLTTRREKATAWSPSGVVPKEHDVNVRETPVDEIRYNTSSPIE